MKLSRKMFERTKTNFPKIKFYKITEDRYIAYDSVKSLLNVAKLIWLIVSLPFKIIGLIGIELLIIALESPQYFKEIWKCFKDISPILFLKIKD